MSLVSTAGISVELVSTCLEGGSMKIKPKAKPDDFQKRWDAVMASSCQLIGDLHTGKISVSAAVKANRKNNVALKKMRTEIRALK